MATTNNRIGNSPIYFESATFDAFNSSTLPPGTKVGQTFQKNGNVYQVVKMDSSAVTCAAGHAVAWIDWDDFVVTNDISDTIVNAPAGVALTAVTAGNYCVILVNGTYASVKTDAGDDISANDTLIMDPTTDGSVDSVAAGTAPTHIILGYATAADVDTLDTVAAFICPPRNGF